ncbi:hypothetical protein [Alcanivorax sp.]|jgi:hypothetical protein|uniref:hypothetical protein n=1 Tax=Alcanivorax sp. TaxID=1872427 RepID=UPI0032D91856
MSKQPAHLKPIYPAKTHSKMNASFLGYVALFTTSEEILAFGGYGHPEAPYYRTDHPAWAHRFETLEDLNQFHAKAKESVLPLALYDTNGKLMLEHVAPIH